MVWMGLKQGWHLHDSMARIATTQVVPVRKLVVNWREVCVNPSCHVGTRIWNVQNFGLRVVNYAQTVRELVRRMRASVRHATIVTKCHE